MSESLTKNALIAEISGVVKLSKADIGRVLDRLTEIAYREAHKGFVIPGICKLKVVTKKASRRRNPVTGKVFLIGERQALKIVPLKKAKTIIAPNEGVVIEEIEAPPPEAAAPAVPQPAAPAAPAAPAPAGDKVSHSEEGQILFPCPECGSMLAAHPTAAGQKGKCPFCNGDTQVPGRQADSAPARAVVNTPERLVSDYVLLICHACGQEIEAPADMIGMQVECPTCSTGLTVPIAEAPERTPIPVEGEAAGGQGKKPKDRSSMTLRIDLSDIE